MEYIYAVETSGQLAQYQCFAESIRPVLDEYIAYLQREFQAKNLPETILWTSRRIATEVLSNIPVPAYTNSRRIVMACDPEDWKSVYLSQLDGLPEPKTASIRHYYCHDFSRNNILQILGHELAHHSEYFLDDAYDSGKGIWFEEGMAEYISRRYFLTEEEFTTETQINRQLLALSAPLPSLVDTFSDQHNYTAIFRAYWQSFLAVNQIVDAFGGNLKAVFASYHHWFKTGCKQSLEDWFQEDVHK